MRRRREPNDRKSNRKGVKWERPRCSNCGKVQFATEREADFASQRLARTADLPLRPYYDHKCGCWHLTAQEKRCHATRPT